MMSVLEAWPFNNQQSAKPLEYKDQCLLWMAYPFTGSSSLAAFGNIMDTFSRQKSIVQPIVSFWFNRDSSISVEGSAGGITIGGYDPSLLVGSLMQIPLVNNSTPQWQLLVTRIMVGVVDMLADSAVFTIEILSIFFLPPFSISSTKL
jgi:hypothetical protein